MSLTNEIERLGRLRQDGLLTDAEFTAAKRKLIDAAGSAGPTDTAEDGQRGLGEAANRYVTFTIIMSVIGLAIFLTILFTVVLPHIRSVESGFDSSPTFPRMSGNPR